MLDESAMNTIIQQGERSNQHLRQPVVLIGVGEMAGIFARGLLRIGCPLVPVTRHMDIDTVADAAPDVALVLVTVAEDDLQPVLEKMPREWRDRIGLLQNELLPRNWEAYDVAAPTVIVVWFEKKKGQEYKVIIGSYAYGASAELMVQALRSLDIPCQALDSESELVFELVRKNVYILTINIAGLVTGGTVGDLWQQHRVLAQQVAEEIIEIQAWLTGAALAQARLIAGMLEAIDADPGHRCTGRSAPARLVRALRDADAAGLAVPTLRTIAARR